MPINIDTRNFNQDNIGGGKELLYIPVKDVQYIAPAVAGYIRDTIVLKSGKAFYRATFVMDTLSMKTGRGIVNGATAYTCEINGDVPKQRIELLSTFKSFDDNRYILVYRDNNGNQRLIGNLRNPARFIDLSATDGGQVARRNETTLQFNWVSDKQPPYYEQDLSVYEESQYKKIKINYTLQNATGAGTIFDMDDEQFTRSCRIVSGTNISPEISQIRYSIDGAAFQPITYPFVVNNGHTLSIQIVCAASTTFAKLQLNGIFL